MSIEDSLLKLNELKEKGVITSEEFSKRKAEILAGSEKNPIKGLWRQTPVLMIVLMIIVIIIYSGLSKTENKKITTGPKLPACNSIEAISTLRGAYDKSQFARALNLSVIDINKSIEASISKPEKRYCTAILTLNNTNQILVEYSMEIKDNNNFILFFKEIETINKLESDHNTLLQKSQVDTNLPGDFLIQALAPNKERTGRIGESRVAIQEYTRNGIIDKEPNQSSDYTDYYIIKKPINFLGHELVILEEEHPGTVYLGCCVSPGMGLVLKVKNSIENLNKFANENACSLKENIKINEIERDIGIKLGFQSGNYVSLSCRERDLS